MRKHELAKGILASHVKKVLYTFKNSISLEFRDLGKYYNSSFFTHIYLFCDWEETIYLLLLWRSCISQGSFWFRSKLFNYTYRFKRLVYWKYSIRSNSSGLVVCIKSLVFAVSVSGHIFHVLYHSGWGGGYLR